METRGTPGAAVAAPDFSSMSDKAGAAEDLLKRLANRNRLMVLCALAERRGELSVGELNERVPLSQSSLSQHLSVLREAGLVATRRDAQTIFYRIADARVDALLRTLHHLFCLN